MCSYFDGLLILHNILNAKSIGMHVDIGIYRVAWCQEGYSVGVIRV